ncbi:uncharacterized protein BXZ73DRAFT_73526 [Epithele typhae]|uniref:uncharacterized protein n=1 Tax=Epithele typhae TaxID=378194 RepID=UPI002007E36A|nr:uncharacterized protein BXZ73DRAFT_73526 [Epithele typhae]KAH9945371.1 hypothetical protein BXZ73DRAFT_73526 [Epithele typhae]
MSRTDLARRPNGGMSAHGCIIQAGYESRAGHGHGLKTWSLRGQLVRGFDLADDLVLSALPVRQDTVNLFFLNSVNWYLLVARPTTGPLVPWTAAAQLLTNRSLLITLPLGVKPSHYSESALVFGDFVVAFWRVSHRRSALRVEPSDSEQATTRPEFIALVPIDIGMSTLTAVTDLALSGTLVVLLARARTGSTGARRLINSLMIFTINTGLVTSLLNIVTVICLVLFPDYQIYLVFYYTGARNTDPPPVYTISLMATLNAREGFREKVNRIGDTSPPPHLANSISSIRFAAERRTFVDAAPRSRAGIHVAIRRDTAVTFVGSEDGSSDYERPGQSKRKGTARASATPSGAIPGPTRLYMPDMPWPFV